MGHDAIITGSSNQSPAPKRPRFLWRGLLIVLPALAMAGFGFVSLRQDRLLVRHQATEQAEKLAAELAQVILPAALYLDLQAPDAVGSMSAGRPQTDPSANGKPVVRLSVYDEGPGIPEEDRELIFQRFYRRGTELRRETQGIGLGLAIVRYITEAHGGSVRVECQPGQGSRFIVELPVASKEKT